MSGGVDAREPLTTQALEGLGVVLAAVEGGMFVRRWVEAVGDVVEGTVRYGFVGGSADVRDQFVQVTTVGGVTVRWPVMELVSEVGTGGLSFERERS